MELVNSGKVKRYTREKLMAINEKRSFEAPKALADFKSCFVNAERDRLYFSWSAEKFWAIKQSEKQNSWRFESARNVKSWSSAKRRDSLKDIEEKKSTLNKQAVDPAVNTAIKECSELLEAKKREIYELAEKAESLSKQLFDLHKTLCTSKSEADELNTSSISSGYNSMESSINNKSIHETSSPVLAASSAKKNVIEEKKTPKKAHSPTKPANPVPVVETAGLIEHVRKVYQNALIRSQLSKSSAKVQVKQI